MSEQADLIIVGGGTAGCVLAARLSAHTHLRVLLLEAGDKPTSAFVGIPAGFSKLFGSRCDWAFSTTPQTAAGRCIFTPRGRMLGGSSAMNAQIHQWGHPADFDGWRDNGAAGWGWDDVSPVFRRLEKYSGEGQGRGCEGSLPAEPLASPLPQSLAFVESVRSIFGTQTPSYNGAAYEGAWISEVNHSQGRRVSAFDAWLAPAMRRPNLRVQKNTTAMSIVFEGKRATGVRVASGAGEQTLLARRGVIVCAGAFGSPHLLMCSGIGPAAHLAKMGVPVVHDAPAVGSNLHDHPMACPTFTTSGKSLKSAESLSNLLNYILARKGMLASNVAEAVAFLRSPYADGAPDLELLFAPVEWREEGLKPPRVDGFTIAVIALTPGSRGTLKLKSRDIRTAPRIDPALLSDSAGTDRLVMSFGLQLARQIANTKPLSLASGDEIEPGTSCDNWEAQQEWLNQSVQTVYHPAGTCRMGTGPDTVVSPSLAVKGVENLWIADASVMPAVTRGHPNAAVAMIAERGAEFIAAAL